MQFHHHLARAILANPMNDPPSSYKSKNVGLVKQFTLVFGHPPQLETLQKFQTDKC
jgi:hypothetical protein